MQSSKEQVKESIVVVSDYLGLLNPYKIMLNSIGFTIPEVVKSLSYDMFLAKFDLNSCPLNIYAHYCVIHEYATELSQNGHVEFSKN